MKLFERNCLCAGPLWAAAPDRCSAYVFLSTVSGCQGSRRAPPRETRKEILYPAAASPSRGDFRILGNFFPALRGGWCQSPGSRGCSSLLGKSSLYIIRIGHSLRKKKFANWLNLRENSCVNCFLVVRRPVQPVFGNAAALVDDLCSCCVQIGRASCRERVF